MWHVIVLSIVTLKIYFVYWCYKTWRDYSKHIAQKNSAKLDPETAALPATEISNNETNGDAIGIESGFATPATKEMGFIEALSPKHLSSFENMSPHIRMICALAPYVQDYLFFTLLYGVAKRHPDPNNVIAKNAFLWSFFLTMFAFSVSLLVFLPGIWYLLFLLSSIPTFWAQAVINEYWDNEERNQSLIVRQAFTGKEIFVTISGALVLGFLVSGILLGADK
ncbi:MAG: DUF4234 domain-containing protein [Candidatus Obscuribacterales bacterium]|nr:DUF4234 domain-containing protein [Candidatus Obscuribacterales bacterium]